MVATILEFVKILYRTHCWIIRHQCFFQVKYSDNRLNGSKVIALYPFTRWQSPLSRFCKQNYIRLVCRKICHRFYFPVKYGDNRLNGSKVIALYPYTRWRSLSCWIIKNVILDQLFEEYYTDSTFPSNMVTISSQLYGSQVIVGLLHLLFPRWRSTSSWIVSYTISVSVSVSYFWTIRQFQTSWKSVKCVKSHSDSLISRIGLGFQHLGANLGI